MRGRIECIFMIFKQALFHSGKRLFARREISHTGSDGLQYIPGRSPEHPLPPELRHLRDLLQGVQVFPFQFFQEWLHKNQWQVGCLTGGWYILRRLTHTTDVVADMATHFSKYSPKFSRRFASKHCLDVKIVPVTDVLRKYICCRDACQGSARIKPVSAYATPACPAAVAVPASLPLFKTRQASWITPETFHRRNLPDR